MMVFQTTRLIIRRALPTDDDVDMYYRLWTHPKVMTMVGYAKGLRITPDEIRSMLAADGDSEFNRRLVVVSKKSGRLIGECLLRRPDVRGDSETDVKLFPEYWGQGYGTEIKRGLVDYLFTHTDCRAVKASPNKNNIASQKMQEAVGARRVGEGVFVSPDKSKGYTCDVPYYLYKVLREDWERLRKKSADDK